MVRIKNNGSIKNCKNQYKKKIVEKQRLDQKLQGENYVELCKIKPIKYLSK